jgi:hypothetical protein
VFAMGLTHLASSSPSLIAREKAREAVESVHTARDSRLITWAEINNVANGGKFVSGAQPLRRSGRDGIVNTEDDAAAEMETARKPGPDGLLGTADDRFLSLGDFTRQIEISPVLDVNGVANPTLRQIRVTVRYRVGRVQRDYVLTTFISAIS